MVKYGLGGGKFKLRLSTLEDDLLGVFGEEWNIIEGGTDFDVTPACWPVANLRVQIFNM